jgi:outer membrane protein OmpA-like peptidoglycan-associated protein
MVLCLGAPLEACRKNKPDEANKPAMALDGEATKKSLEGLEPQLNELLTKFAALHKQYDPLPASLPGFGDVRSKFYATGEALGRVSAKIAWLSDRLDAALKSGDREELRQVSKDIAKTHDEIRQIDKVTVELVHQVLPFQRMMKELEAQENAASPSFARALATGYSLQGAKGGLEQRLLEFIEDPPKKADKATWFDFDRALFVRDGVVLDAAATVQLKNVVEILRAYPNVKLEVDVYADKTGTPASKKLADDRAEAVKKELLKLGADASRLETERPPGKRLVCPSTDKDECRSKSRRAALRVTAK